MRAAFYAAAALGCALSAQAVTIYTTFITDANGKPIPPTYTNTAVGPAYTGFAVYNTTQLVPPVTAPEARGGQDFGINLGLNGMAGLSIPIKGNYMGMSIELSVANQFLGRNSSAINPVFLNHLANIRQRAGQGPAVRVGGNSQEYTRLFLDHSFTNYEFLNKTPVPNPVIPTSTPEVDIDIDLLYALANISALTNTQWYMGLAFSYPVNNTGNALLAEYIENILGDNLIALQLGNEPDLYGQQHRKRPTDYLIPEYITEMQAAITEIQTKVKREKVILAPSVCCNIDKNWGTDQLFDAGFLTQFANQLSHLSVQHYPHNNCPGAGPADAQTIFPEYLRHSSVTGQAAAFLDFANAGIAAGNIPAVMFETNTGSCSGWPGLSNSFASGLWGIDWALSLAANNFSQVLFHFGGQDAAYNPFTPPPSNFSDNFQWTTSPLYYSMLVVAEALGGSNISQVVDLQANNKNDLTPAYAIYEGGKPERVLLINYINDPSDASTYRSYIHVGGQFEGTTEATPQSVTVRYLLAPQVQSTFNVTWAGQTLGGMFESDGRLKGEVKTETVQCAADTGCQISVPAPGLALVFLNPTADQESSNPDLSMTYPTTYFGRGAGPTIEQAVLETSNGRGGQGEKEHPLGSTSHGQDGGAMRMGASLGLTGVAMAIGAAIVSRMLVGAGAGAGAVRTIDW